jgi:hypothetical protein
MSWYYNKLAGEVFEATGWLKFTTDREIDLEKGAAALGVPQTYFGPFATKANAEAYKTANPAVIPTIEKGAQKIAAAPGDVQGFVSQLTNNITHNAEQLVIRVLEAAVGIVLLAIALNVILKQATGKDIGIAGPKRIKQGIQLVATKKVGGVK